MSTNANFDFVKHGTARQVRKSIPLRPPATSRGLRIR